MSAELIDRDDRFQANFPLAEMLHKAIERADDWVYDAARGRVRVGRLVVMRQSRLAGEQEATFQLGRWSAKLPPEGPRRHLRRVR